MSDYSYLFITLNLKQSLEDILTAYVQGAIENSLTQIFGEIGGCTEVEILDHSQQSFVLKTPSSGAKKVRAALTLIAEFQSVPCYFKVTRISSLYLPAVRS